MPVHSDDKVASVKARVEELEGVPAIFQWLATPLRSAVGSAVMLAVAVRCGTDHNVSTVAHPSEWWANDTAALRYAAGHCSGREWGGCDVWQWPP